MNMTTLAKIFTIEKLRVTFGQPRTIPAPKRELKRAAVAMLLSGAPPFKIFFIVRAHHSGDPWSGDIGFPGGKIEQGESTQQAAERETLEEVGISLSSTALLGHLEPIRGAHLPVEIHCLLYHLDDTPEVTSNHEVARSFWCDTTEILQPFRFGEFPVQFGVEKLMRPGIRILADGQPVLWGITYRLLHQLFTRMDIPFPPK